MILTRHPNYERVAAAAQRSRNEGRNIAHISEEIIGLARLYCYAFRGHVIGAFHATKVALLESDGRAKESPSLAGAILELLKLEEIATEPVPADFTVVCLMFQRYDEGLNRVLSLLSFALEDAASEELKRIRDHFVSAMERITCGSGLAVTRDDEVPEQSSLVVKNLGITIVPLVYGDNHSWNLALLSQESPDVPRHFHQEGAEIHLGCGELHGYTSLGAHFAEVHEGYAMPIRAGTPHGFVNLKNQGHKLPFIFGSRRLGGWGIIPDVNPQPLAFTDAEKKTISDPELAGTVLIDKKIQQIREADFWGTQEVIGEEHTSTPAAGGLRLDLCRLKAAQPLPSADFRIIRVVRGEGIVAIAGAETKISERDHFGIPSGMTAHITPRDKEFIFLEATFVP